MGLIKNHLRKMAGNAVGGALGTISSKLGSMKGLQGLGSLMDGAFNEKISGSAAALGKNFAKLKGESNFIFEENEYSFGQLSFPKEIGTENSSNGHYMLFYINVPEEEVSDNGNAGNLVNKDLGFEKESGSVAKQLNGGKIRSLNAALATRKQRKRTSNVISLYMPPEISASYGVDYNREDIGAIARGIDNTFFENFSKENLAGTLQQVGGAAVDMAAPGMAALLQARTNKATNNRLEMTFSGVKPREFQYNFKFTPSSEEEANEIQSILYLFKYHMHPTLLGSQQSAFMRVPSSFNIHYMYRTDENKFLNTIGESVLTSLDVKYGDGDVFKTYRGTPAGAPPRTISATLTFNELDIHDKKSVFEHELPPNRSKSSSPVTTGGLPYGAKESIFSRRVGKNGLKSMGS
jgi:hypothetical protein